MPHKLTTCTFCGVGCGLYLETAANQVIGAYPSVSHPTNAGRICLRGWHGHEIASSPDRLRAPLLKKNGRFEEVGWDEAFVFIADRLREIRDRYGPDALAFLNSPRCSNEEAYLLQKFARAVIGTNNVHHGTGVYCNNSINVLMEMLGVPASTNSISELPQSEVILVDGVDLARRMPTIAGAVIRAKLQGSKLIVVGTRRHRLAENADLFLQIRPNTEALLYGAITKVIVDRGLENLAFIKTRCSNHDAFLAQVHQYDLLEAAEGCGVSAGLIEAAALAYAQAKSAALLYSTSMEERTRDSVRAVVNLVLLTGNLGKLGGGLFALTEQNNLQGVCDMGMLPDRLPGYRPVTQDADRAALESIWGAKIPSTPGQGARSILAHPQPDTVKALWLCRYDPVSTTLFDARDCLSKFELIVVQHIFMNETAKYAHVVLPTTAYGEERVSFTNTERRIQLAEQVVEPRPGLTPAWEQIHRVARLMGADWTYQSAADVMREIGEVVPFYGAADYENLAREYGRQWPCTKDRPLGTRFLFEDDGAARPPFKFIPVPTPKPVSASSKDFPFTLVGGSSLYYWNQSTLIRHSETLRREYNILFTDYPQGFVEIHPEDAKDIGIRDGDGIRLCAQTGSGVSTARVTAEARRGTIFVPYFEYELEKQILGASRNGSSVVPVRVEKEVA